MKAVYFPKTYIEPDKAEWIANRWGPLLLLQPSPETGMPAMDRLQQSGFVETVYPATAIGGSLLDILADFKQWAARHSGSDLAAMMEHNQAIPYFDSFSTTQIAADIRKGDANSGSDPEQDQRSRFLQACLLLAMAQEFDFQQAALARDLEALTVQENKMMAHLKGENAAATVVPSMADSAASSDGSRMRIQRLKAWAHVMADALKDQSVLDDSVDILYLTDCRETWSQIQEVFPQIEVGWQSWKVNAAPTMQSDLWKLPEWLANSLASFADSIAPSDDQRLPAIELMKISQISARSFPVILWKWLHGMVADDLPPADQVSCWVAGITWQIGHRQPVGLALDDL